MAETRSATRDPRFLIIGAGMSGILSAIKLQEAGLTDFTVYEKADRLGGTWRENAYPGIGCDVPSHLYCYSFAPKPDWSHRFSPGAEIQAYFEEVARRYGVDKFIKYGQEITRCRFEDGRWHLETADGTTDEGDFVIAATGVLHHPSYPDIEGLDSFEGSCFHSARWDHDVTVEDKRIGVIGTGSTAIQIVSALAPTVGKLTLFQRTPQWIMPQENAPYTEEEKKYFREEPEVLAAMRDEISTLFADTFSNAVVDANSSQLEMIEVVCRENLENSVHDPELREKLRPNYRAGCKRLIMSEDFYAAIQKPNAELVTDPIERIEAKGVRTANGRLHEFDVLALATGFKVDRFMRPIEIVGRGGVTLDDAWAERPTAYLAISVPDFPNLFMLNGPNGPVGNFSLIEVAELQLAYIMALVELFRSGRAREVSASRAATEKFDEERVEAAKNTIWQTGCSSWYLDDRGVPAVWPWTFDLFRERMAEPRLDDFELV